MRQANVAVDGLRHPVDYREPREDVLSSSFHLLYIDTPRNIRWMRLQGHGKYQTLEAFEAADSHPVEQQIENAAAERGCRVATRGSPEDLYASLDRVILELQSEGKR